MLLQYRTDHSPGFRPCGYITNNNMYFVPIQCILFCTLPFQRLIKYTTKTDKNKFVFVIMYACMYDTRVLYFYKSKTFRDWIPVYTNPNKK